MRKLTLTFLIAASMSIFSHAADYRLKVTDIYDSQINFIVNDQLTMKFHNNFLSLQTPEGSTELIFDDIKKMEYEADKSSVAASEISQAHNQICISPDAISFIYPESKELSFVIYDMQGHIIEQRTFFKKFNLSLSDFASGVYILKIETIAPIKFIVK